MWIPVPAVFDVPEPWLVPQHIQSKYETVRVIEKTPCILTEFD